jgi:hypothetical protein
MKAGEGGGEVVKPDIGEEHPVQNTKGSGAWASGAEHHACAQWQDRYIYILTDGFEQVWQSCCETLKTMNGDERKKNRSN